MEGSSLCQRDRSRSPSRIRKGTVSQQSRSRTNRLSIWPNPSNNWPSGPNLRRRLSLSEVLASGAYVLPVSLHWDHDTEALFNDWLL